MKNHTRLKNTLNLLSVATLVFLFANILVANDGVYKVAAASSGVPEPARIALIGLGLIGIARWKRR